MAARSLTRRVSRQITRSLFVAVAALGLGLGAVTTAGCGKGRGPSPLPDELVLGELEKADQGSSAQIVRDIDLNSKIDGAFNDRTRVYGFTFEAKAGAVVTVNVSTKAGSTSSDAEPGSALDTVLAVYGPLRGDDRGTKIVTVDDDESGTAAQLPPLEIKEDGRYLVALSTWQDPGNGTYQIQVGCQGTDFQCRRPVANIDCDPQTRYIVGGTVIGTETWNQCKVVLLETTKVSAGSVLTIRPGVNVQGNYLGTGDFGTVALEVDGTLQAVGTPEAPVVFSSVKQGWKGLVLNGSSNTLQHAYVENAEVGITVRGTNNTFTDLNVNHSDTGLFFDAGSKDNLVQRVRIAEVRDGVHLRGAATIEDSVILSREARGGSGIWGEGAQELSIFRRALIAGFGHGLYLVSTQLQVEDATIANNTHGVLVTGENAGVHPALECPAFPAAQPNPPWTPIQPTTWGRDPVFIRCDIVKNEKYGIRIEAPELLVVEDSNVHGNLEAGIVVAADALHPESRIVRSNIFGNGTSGVQVESMHSHGQLDISGNYWAQISDPELSASWLMEHTQSRECTGTRNNSCTWNGSRYVCGAYVCDSDNRTCRTTASTTWKSPFTFTGFSPTPLKAGPDLHKYEEQVMQERAEQGL